MKIIVEFLRAEQHWLPDTGDQQNYLVFGFGGREHRIPCKEQDIIQAIREAQSVAGTVMHPADTRPAPSFTPEEDADGSAPDELEQEMLGSDEDVVTNPPVIFENPVVPPVVKPKSSVEQRVEGINELLASRPRSRQSIKEAKLARMKEVAKRAPVRTTSADEMGNPNVPESQQLSGPMPTVRSVERVEAPDDDQFEQG